METEAQERYIERRRIVIRLTGSAHQSGGLAHRRLVRLNMRSFGAPKDADRPEPAELAERKFDLPYD